MAFVGYVANIFTRKLCNLVRVRLEKLALPSSPRSDRLLAASLPRVQVRMSYQYAMKRLRLNSSQGGLLKDSLQLVKVQNSDGRSRYQIKPLEEKLSFDKGFFVFIRAVQLLVSRNKGVILVRPNQIFTKYKPT